MPPMKYRRGARVRWAVRQQRLGRIVQDDGGPDVTVKWDDMGFNQSLARRFVESVTPSRARETTNLDNADKRPGETAGQRLSDYARDLAAENGA